MVGVVADEAVDLDHLLVGDVGVLERRDPVPLVPVDRLVRVALGIVGDDERAAGGPRQHRRLDVHGSVVGRPRRGHALGQLVQLLLRDVAQYPATKGITSTQILAAVREHRAAVADVVEPLPAALRATGVIRGYHADVALEALGRRVQALIAVRTRPPSREHIEAFRDWAGALPETIGVFVVSGGDDFLLHVAVPDTDALYAFVIALSGATFGATSAPYQHFAQASMRAIEEEGSGVLVALHAAADEPAAGTRLYAAAFGDHALIRDRGRRS